MARRSVAKTATRAIKLAHVPEKWIPVFRKGHAQRKNLERILVQLERDAL